MAVWGWSCLGCCGYPDRGICSVLGKREWEDSIAGSRAAVSLECPWSPRRLCSFAERDEIARSRGSISSPTFGWEKQNYSNGVSRTEGAKGWMRVGDGVPLMPCHSWSIHCALRTLGTWAELPSQGLGSRTHIWVHHVPTVLNSSPLQGLHPALPPPPWAPRNPQKASQAPGDTVGWGDARDRKMACCEERGTVPLFGSCSSCSVGGGGFGSPAPSLQQFGVQLPFRNSSQSCYLACDPTGLA